MSKDDFIEIKRPILITFIIGIIILLLNIQWMILYQLSNAPAGDSLVYITEAFNDYWLVRDGNYIGILIKYYKVGNQINSPLLSLMAVFSFLLFGLNPINAYLVMWFLYLLWVAGIVYLSWVIKQDEKFTLACGLLAVLLPSASVYQLRHFMLDFAAATPFIWATAFLIKSDLLNRRNYAILYALLASLTILFRSTAFMYLFSHVGIIFLQSFIQKKRINFKNAFLVLLIIIIITGTFIFPNLNRIIGYYGYWAQEASMSSVKNSFLGNLRFYLHELSSFHMLRPGFAVYCSITVIGALILIKRKFIGKIKNNSSISTELLFILPLIFIPTTILANYSSRASSVDFVFIGAYLFLPVIFWRNIFPGDKYFWAPIAIIMLGFVITDSGHLIRGAQTDLGEREVLAQILSDAERRGLREITLGNTAIHQHNSLSYQYWTLANYFPRWTNKVKLAAIGRTSSPEELAKMNGNADYVIALEHYKADWVPNNIVAPEANAILQNKFHMVALPFEYVLSDGVIVKILARQVAVTYGRPYTDGWHENGVIVKVNNPRREEVILKLSGALMNLRAGQERPVVSLRSLSNPQDILSFVALDGELNHAFTLPAKFFKSGSDLEFLLDNSLAGSPAAISASKDNRNLAFKNLRIQIVN